MCNLEKENKYVDSHFKVTNIDGGSATIYYKSIPEEKYTGKTLASMLVNIEPRTIKAFLKCEGHAEIVRLKSHNGDTNQSGYEVKCWYVHFEEAMNNYGKDIINLDLMNFVELGIYSEEEINKISKMDRFRISSKKEIIEIFDFTNEYRNFRLKLREDLFKKIASTSAKTKVSTDNIINSLLEMGMDNVESAANMCIVRGENKLIEMLETGKIIYKEVELNFSTYELDNNVGRDRQVTLFNNDGSIISKLTIDLLKL
ncbi:hypothetical protein UT300012_22350 [Paraclostridium bifermentans]